MKFRHILYSIFFLYTMHATGMDDDHDPVRRLIAEFLPLPIARIAMEEQHETWYLSEEQKVAFSAQIIESNAYKQIAANPAQYSNHLKYFLNNAAQRRLKANCRHCIAACPQGPVCYGAGYYAIAKCACAATSFNPVAFCYLTLLCCTATCVDIQEAKQPVARLTKNTQRTLIVIEILKELLNSQ